MMVSNWCTSNGRQCNLAPYGLFAILPFTCVMHGGTQISAGIHMGDDGMSDDVHAATLELSGQRCAGATIPRGEYAILANQQRYL